MPLWPTLGLLDNVRAYPSIWEWEAPQHSYFAPPQAFWGVW